MSVDAVKEDKVKPLEEHLSMAYSFVKTVLPKEIVGLIDTQKDISWLVRPSNIESMKKNGEADVIAYFVYKLSLLAIRRYVSANKIDQRTLISSYFTRFPEATSYLVTLMYEHGASFSDKESIVAQIEKDIAEDMAFINLQLKAGTLDYFYSFHELLRRSPNMANAPARLGMEIGASANELWEYKSVLETAKIMLEVYKSYKDARLIGETILYVLHNPHVMAENRK
ncbi:MAG: hypothetical protein ACP5GD_03035 [Candidatus Micrarchaeia archaeon]